MLIVAAGEIVGANGKLLPSSCPVEPEGPGSQQPRKAASLTIEAADRCNKPLGIPRNGRWISSILEMGART